MLVSGHAAVLQRVGRRYIQQCPQAFRFVRLKQVMYVAFYKDLLPQQLLLLFQQGAVPLRRQLRLVGAQGTEHIGGKEKPRVFLYILAGKHGNSAQRLGCALQMLLHILLVRVGHIKARAVVSVVARVIQGDRAPRSGSVASYRFQGVRIHIQNIGSAIIEGVRQLGRVNALLIAQLAQTLPKTRLPAVQADVALLAHGLPVHGFVHGIGIDRIKIGHKLLAGACIVPGDCLAHRLGKGQRVQLVAQLAATGIARIQHGIFVLLQKPGIILGVVQSIFQLLQELLKLKHEQIQALPLSVVLQTLLRRVLPDRVLLDLTAQSGLFLAVFCVIRHGLHLPVGVEHQLDKGLLVGQLCIGSHITMPSSVNSVLMSYWRAFLT